MADWVDKKSNLSGEHGARREATVGVIIPTYNRADLVGFAIESVLQQTHRPDSVVVVDDGSTDDTASRVKGYGSRICYLYQENQGKPAAINHALAHIEGDYIWILDDDDYAFPDALARHLQFLGAHPEVDFSYSGLYFFEGEGAPPPLSQCHPWQPPDVAHREFFIRAMERFPANQQTMLVPRSCYQAIGSHDESMKYGEDYDAILRLARHYRAARLPEPILFLRQHGGARGPASERRKAEDKGAAWQIYNRKIFKKLRRALALYEYLPRGSVDGDTLTALQSRRAFLQRACIMARRGLFEEALEDLAQCLTGLGAKEPLTPEERSICERMLNFDDPVQPLSNAFIRRLTRLLRGRAPNLLKRILAGLYWGLRREARAGHYLQAAQLGLSLTEALALVGVGRLYGNRRQWQHEQVPKTRPDRPR